MTIREIHQIIEGTGFYFDKYDSFSSYGNPMKRINHDILINEEKGIYLSAREKRDKWKIFKMPQEPTGYIIPLELEPMTLTEIMTSLETHQISVSDSITDMELAFSINGGKDMRNIWETGFTIKDNNGKNVEITPEMLIEINKQIKIQRSYDIVACHVSYPNCSDEQLLAVAEKVEAYESENAGNDEYDAIVNILGSNVIENDLEL